MTRIFKISFDLPSIDAVGPMELLLEGLSSAISSSAIPGSDKWLMELYVEGIPDHAMVSEMIAVGARAADIPVPDFLLQPLPDQDWVAENQRSFPPILAGRYFVHPSGYDGRIAAGQWPIIMDAGAAFGTGSHGTTLGCLQTLDALAKARQYRNILDLGSGTGILAIGAAHAWKAAKILASDIDPQAVEICGENAAANGFRHAVQTALADGMQHEAIRRAAPFDLLIANILAKPLCIFSKGICAAVSRGGDIVLSGLLIEQEAMVLAAYRKHGAMLVRRRHIEGWSTLLLRMKR